MASPNITAADVDPGVYFLREEDKSLWRCVAYAAQPTATLERVDAGGVQAEFTGDAAVPLLPLRTFGDQRLRVGGVIGAPIFDGFVRLVPEPE